MIESGMSLSSFVISVKGNIMNRLIIVFAAICFMAVVVWGDDRSTGLVPGEGFVEVIGGKVWY
ncbi:hypothetical protein KKA00_02660, partial [bacterium]|nr:hypothetical protein [bacterium]